MEDIYLKYNVHKVINASGKMTILGGSRLSLETCQQMNLGASHFFEMSDLLDQVGIYIANLLNVEASYIVNSASGAIAQSIAACISKGKLETILDLYNPNIQNREVVICKGHNVDYGTTIEVPIKMGGGKVVEAGYANKCTLAHVESKINENTVALLYVKSHHCVQKGMPSIEEFIELGHEYDLPVIVDAAAEEDLSIYYKQGADAVIYSGTKALAGPTSGLIIGKKSFIDKVKQQSIGIGRVMKVGKESILGLAYAIEQYVKVPTCSLDKQFKRFEKFNQKLNLHKGVFARCMQDSAGRNIIRSEITFNQQQLSLSAKAVSQALKEGEVRIYTRDYRANEGVLEIDIRDVSDEELDIIYDKIIEIIGGSNNENVT